MGQSTALDQMIRALLTDAFKRNDAIDVLENGQSADKRAQQLQALASPWGYNLAYDDAKRCAETWDASKANNPNFVSEWQNNPPTLSPLVDSTMIFS